MNLNKTKTLILFSRTVEEADGYLEEYTREKEVGLKLATLKGMFEFEIVGRKAEGSQAEYTQADYYSALAAIMNKNRG